LVVLLVWALVLVRRVWCLVVWFSVVVLVLVGGVVVLGGGVGVVVFVPLAIVKICYKETATDLLYLDRNAHATRVCDDLYLKS
jgi:hypothetical protein